MPERTPGIIVTYFPDPDLEIRLAAIAREISPVLVVDNTANAAMSDRLAAACERCGCRLLLNRSNLGIAAALNRGFGELEQLGFIWAVAFDQDSTPEPGLVGGLMECARRICPARPPAVVGANWRDEARPNQPSLHLRPHPACRLLFERVPARDDLDDVTCVINSGSLFHLPTWRALGGFDESLFLDLVDTDYCLRARQAGHRIGVASRACLRHRRGSKRAGAIPWRHLVARFHAAPAPVSSLSQPRMAVPPASLADAALGGVRNHLWFQDPRGDPLPRKRQSRQIGRVPPRHLGWCVQPSQSCHAPRCRAFINPPWAGLKKHRAKTVERPELGADT